MTSHEWQGTGKTSELAILKGLKELKLYRGQVDIEILGEKTSGLFSLFGFKRVEVKLTPKPGVLRKEWSEKREDRFRDHPKRFDRDRGNKGNRFENRGREDRGDRRSRDERPGDRREKRFEDRPKRGDNRPDRPSSRNEERQDRSRSDRNNPPPKQNRRDGGGRPDRLPRRDAPAADAPPRPPRDVPTAASLLEQWKPLLGWNDLTWTVPSAEGTETILFEAASAKRLMERNGAPLEALEHLVNTVRIRGDHSIPRVSLRVEGCAPPSELQVSDIALQAALEVKQTGTPFRLEPMSPQERRLVHQTLANHPDVTTTSEGEGPFRKVVVIPRTKG